MASLSATMADHAEMVKQIELSMELKFAKRVAALVERLEKHTQTRNEQFEMLDSFITSIAVDAGEDTLGAGGDITAVLNVAHSINDADNKFLEQITADLKSELPSEAHIDKIQSELSAITEREKAIDKLFEESEEDEDAIKDEEPIKEEKKEETIKLRFESPYPTKLFASVFIKREGRDPTEEDLAREEDRCRAARDKELETVTQRLRQDSGIEPGFQEVTTVVYAQLRDPEYNSDYTPYLRWEPDYSLEYPWWIEMRKAYSDRSNPLDLTRSFGQSTPNTRTKGHSANPRQTNAGGVRSSPSISTRPRSLSTVSQPKQRSSHQRAHSQSSQSSQASSARLLSDTTTKMARLRAKTTANITNKGPPQPPTGKPVERIFEDLTNDSDSGSESPVQLKNSQPPKSMEKLPKQPFFARTRSDGSSSINKRQPSVRSPSVRQGSMPSLLDSEDELSDTHVSGYRSPLRSSTSKNKPATETSRPLPPPTSTQKPASTQIKEQVSDDDVYPRDLSAQLSTQIHGYIEEAVGGVDDRVHRIFKDIALKASLWILENMPPHASLLQSIDSQITTNERNARAANKSLEETLNAHDPDDTGLSPKATDHCKLLDKQEEDRQKSLEGMLEKVERSKRDRAKAMEAIGALRRDMENERDSCNQKEIKEMRRMYGEEAKENSRGIDGDEPAEEQESRKRKRDIETEEHMDIDMLM
ncbi:hypothetical protein KCU65_g2682, partial [Aureobasidium melanogenum]